MSKKVKQTKETVKNITRKTAKSCKKRGCKDTGKKNKKIKTGGKIMLKLENKRFGKLLALNRIVNKNGKQNKYLCKCDCGNEVVIDTSQLNSGGRKSCGCAKSPDVVGIKFGKLLVVKFLKIKDKQRVFKCRCECGNIVNVKYCHLTKGNNRSCGCIKYPNLKGKKFSKLNVLKKGKKIKRKDGSPEGTWLCKCECGNKTTVTTHYLITGHTRSCGCMARLNNSLPYQEAAKNHLYSTYKQGAKNRNIDFDIPRKEFIELTSKDCYYCNCKPNQRRGTTGRHGFNGDYFYNGLDRIDNNMGYLNYNVLPCCGNCNTAKGILTKEEFLKKIHEIYRFLQLDTKLDLIVDINHKIIVYNPMKDILSIESKHKNAIPFGDAAKNQLFCSYRKRARKNQIGFNISKKDFFYLTSCNCYYCGCFPSQIRKPSTGANGNYIYNSLDRLNSNFGYSVKNCVPSCDTCNSMKGTLTKEEFITKIRNISENLKLHE